MKEVKISENGRKVLEVLKEVGEPMNCGDLAKKLDLNPKSLPGLMNGLVKRGLVTASKQMGKKEKMLRLTEYTVLDVSKRFPNKAGDTQYNEKQEAVLKWCAEANFDADATFTSRSLPFKVAPATLTSLVNRGNLAAKPEKKQILVTEEVEQTYYTIADAAE